MTGGEAYGGFDVFNGRNYVSWYLVSQSFTGGAGYGYSTVNFAMAVNFTSGDQCHRINTSTIVTNGVTAWNVNPTHIFSSGHNHPGNYPFVNTIGQGGFAAGTYNINHDSSGAASVVITSSHVGSSGPTSTATINTALPAIPQTVASPSAATATRVSDTQQTINWTNNSTGTAPYANIKVYRATDAGGYALIATLGVVTTYSDTTTSANHKYTYRVSAVGTNTVEVGYATASPVYTTPGAPSGLTATKLAGGNIRLDWANNVGYTEYGIRIEESQNGGAFSEITSVAGGVITYEHVTPNPSVTHTYRIRSRSTVGTLNSAYSANSNTVILLATANPPTNLVPSGSARDATGAIVFTWQHNPADGTPQTKYQLQYKVDAGAYTTVGPTTTAVSSYTLTAATVTNGHTITWHVATAGENATLSAYSADASFLTSDKPTVNITTPTATHNFSTLTAQWTYFQAQSSAQATWVASLYDASMVLLEQRSGTTETSTTFVTSLADATNYTITVGVTSAVGTPSDVDTQAFTVTYLPPAEVHITALYDTDSGSMVLTVIGDAPFVGVTVAISTVTIQRSINDGPWVTIVAGLVLAGDPLTAIVIDTAPTINGINRYRADVRSALPSSALSDVETNETAEPRWSFLSAGPGFAQIVKMAAAPQFKGEVSRVRVARRYAGRRKPVQMEGEGINLDLAVSGTLRDSSSRIEEYEAITVVSGVVLFRGPDGRRIYALLHKLESNKENHRYTDIAFDLTEVDYTE